MFTISFHTQLWFIFPVKISVALKVLISNIFPKYQTYFPLNKIWTLWEILFLLTYLTNENGVCKITKVSWRIIFEYFWLRIILYCLWNVYLWHLLKLCLFSLYPASMKEQHRIHKYSAWGNTLLESKVLGALRFKTAETVRPKFCLGPYVAPGKVYCTYKFCVSRFSVEGNRQKSVPKKLLKLTMGWKCKKKPGKFQG